ncbi:MAG TPA: ester cyclase [Dehalococcoidia bacterium]|nr:ester cyclase [Dehalococcoidia bacterium]
MSSVEENIEVVRRLEEVFNQGNFEILQELITPDYVLHEINQDFIGQEGLKRLVNHLRIPFPDYHQTIEKILGEGDMVVIFYTIRGTFKNELMGIPPTGKQFELNEAVLSRFENGKQAEVWVYYDTLTFYRQLGINPPDIKPI